MRLFRVKRTDNPGWCENISCVVLAADEMWAEKLTRLSSADFRKALLTVEEIDLNQEGVLLTDNTGA